MENKMSFVDLNKINRELIKIKIYITKFVYRESTTDAEAIDYLETIERHIQRLKYEIIPGEN